MEDAGVLLRGIEMIEAQITLTDINVSSYPHLKQQEQRKLHREVYKQAWSPEKKPMTMDKLKEELMWQTMR